MGKKTTTIAVSLGIVLIFIVLSCNKTGIPYGTTNSTGLTRNTAEISKSTAIINPLDGIVSIGTNKIQKDSQGKITHIGNDNVQYDSNGVITHIGNKKVQYDSNGKMTHIGNSIIQYDTNGKILQIGNSRVYY